MSDGSNKGQFVKNDPRFANRPRPLRKPAVIPEGGPSARRRAMGMVTSRFLEDLCSHYEKEGHHVFKIVFRENPETYFRALVSLVPKELLLTQTVNIFGELTDEQIAETVDKVRQLRAIGNGNGNGVVIEH